MKNEPNFKYITKTIDAQANKLIKDENIQIEVLNENIINSSILSAPVSITTSKYEQTVPLLVKSEYGIGLFEVMAFMLGSELNDSFRLKIMLLLTDLLNAFVNDTIHYNDIGFFINNVFDVPNMLIISYPGLIIFSWFLAYERENREDLTSSERNNILKIIKEEIVFHQIFGNQSVYDFAWSTVESQLTKLNLSCRPDTLKDPVGFANTGTKRTGNKVETVTGLQSVATGYWTEQTKKIEKKHPKAVVELHDLHDTK
jgi:hypothetical protein